jgi:uncharacterized membrane protein YfcA
MDTTTIFILLIVFIATLIRSTFGFGESLIAVPLLILFIPIEIAVPFSVLLSVSIAAVIVAQDRKQIHFISAKWLVIFAIPGIPLGLFILIYGNEHFVKSGLGLIIILYAFYSLIGKRKIRLKKKDSLFWLFICGFFSGVFGGAYGLNGPPLVVYGNMRAWTSQYFRATLQAYFLPASIIGMFCYWSQGLWTDTVTHYFFISIPAMIPAIFLGRHLNRRIKDRVFSIIFMVD